MDYGIKGKVALVGGASQGIGRACAEALAREGARVAMCARREDILVKAGEELKETTGAEIVTLAADLGKADDVRRVLSETQSKLGPIDILVTNTGGPPPGLFENFSDDDWDQAYRLLLKSAIGLIRGVLPEMKTRGWGRIIGITSVSVKEPIENLILSNVFRSGVTALFKTLARQVAKDGVTLNTVLPGMTDTERVRGLYGKQVAERGGSVEELIAKMSRGLPLRRLTRADELGEVVAFLASNAASGVTGSAVAADGGQLRGLY